MHGFATLLLGAQVAFKSGKSGRCVAVGQSLQGFGLVLTLLTEAGTLQEGHSSEVESCHLVEMIGPDGIIRPGRGRSAPASAPARSTE